MNDRGASSLLKSKVKLGADPRSPQDLRVAMLKRHRCYLRAEMLSYSRSRSVSPAFP
jgi:hypothetical protein